MHTLPVPKINAPTVAEHREQRRAALLEAAAQLILRDGAFTVAEVAQEVGFSRSAVYEYYSSAADLIADVLVDELADWADALACAVADQDDPMERIHAWVRAVLDYVGDGRHALLRAAGSIDLPPTRRAEVQSQHRDLVGPLHAAVSDLVGLSRQELGGDGHQDPRALAALIWGLVDASISRIEAGATTADAEAPLVLDFIQGGLDRIVPVRDA